MASAKLQHLLQVLEERNVGLVSDDVAWAFESAGTRDVMESWVQEYLQPVSLLTTEEKILCVNGVSSFRKLVLTTEQH